MDKPQSRRDLQMVLVGRQREREYWIRRIGRMRRSGLDYTLAEVATVMRLRTFKVERLDKR